MKNKPAFFINIKLPPEMLDVNLSPDKREVIILHENMILSQLVAEIDKHYLPSRNSMTLPIMDSSLRLNAIPSTNEIVSQYRGESVSSAHEDTPIEWISQANTGSTTPSTSQVTTLDSSNSQGQDVSSQDVSKRRRLHEDDNVAVCPANAPVKVVNSTDGFMESAKDSRSRFNYLDHDLDSSRVLDKADFSKMRVIGQFNLGFMIAEYRNDLYILDQHACDEKYR